MALNGIAKPNNQRTEGDVTKNHIHDMPHLRATVSFGKNEYMIYWYVLGL
jgi:hypothetical protein